MANNPALAWCCMRLMQECNIDHDRIPLSAGLAAAAQTPREVSTILIVRSKIERSSQSVQLAAYARSYRSLFCGLE